MLVQFELIPASFLIFTTFVDLLFRYLVFGRLESIALDIAFFAGAYNVTELVVFAYAVRGKGDPSLAPADLPLLIARLVVSIVALGLLGFIHVALGKRLNARVGQIFDNVGERLPRANRVALEKARPSLERSVLLTFVGYEWSESLRLREGKANWRTEVADFLNALLSAPSRSSTPASTEAFRVTPDAFLLRRRERVIGLLAFALFGSAAFLSPFLVLPSGLLGT